MRRKTFCWFRSETGLKGFDAKPSIGTLKGLVLQFSFNLCCHHLFLSLSQAHTLSLPLSLFSLSNLCCNPFSQKNCCKKSFQQFFKFCRVFQFRRKCSSVGRQNVDNNFDEKSTTSRRKVDEKVDEKSTQVSL